MSDEGEARRDNALDFLDELDNRHDHLLTELEQLNIRIDLVLNEYTKSRQAADVANGARAQQPVSVNLASDASNLQVNPADFD